MSQPSRRNIIQLDAIRSLDQAINAHTLWLGEFHRAVICRAGLDPSVMATDAHRRCVFGRWYYGLDRGEWQQWTTEMDQIGALHQEMHGLAREMMPRESAAKPVDADNYDAFINAAIRFKLSIRSLQFKMINDVCLVDHLTGAWNRGALFQRIAEEYERRLREGGSSCLCMMDLDHFKAVNDTHGHGAGDEVLQAVVAIVKLRLRTYDSVFRYGGEEFLFCLPSISVDGAVAAMDRVRADIEAAAITLKDGHRVPVTASFGVAPLCTTLAIEESIEQADRALFYAKATGRNKVCHWDRETGA
jgi:diguanylate cyclase (GGDEF)-like protein